MRLVAFVILMLAAREARAHDEWAPGMPVPAWVKSSCCGVAHAHMLQPASVHARPDGWHIDGLLTVVPFDKTLPSEDGSFWAFYPIGAPKPPIYCFFAPLEGF